MQVHGSLWKEGIMSSILLDIGLIMIGATVIGALAKLLRQPLIPAYIIAGIILGPITGWISDEQTIQVVAEIGIAFLLFIVGMELDLRRLKEIGPVATVGGIMQVSILFLLGMLTGIFLGFDMIPSLYIGIIMAFSSTMVVIKLLGDKNELDTLHGRIVIGFLLVQDLFAVIVLSIIGQARDTGISAQLGFMMGIGLLFLAFFLGRFIFPPLFAWAAKTPELLFLMAVSSCLAFSLLFVGAGFSIVIGAFIAGIMLGNLQYNVEIASRIRPLKDFFSVIFFVAIGLNLQLMNITHLILPLIILLLFTVIVLPVITIAICTTFGYKRRTAFLAGISLAQLSEFSLIIVTLGLSLGHIGRDIFTMTIILTIITIALTSYLIQYEEKLYHRLQKPLRFFERMSRKTREFENITDTHKHKVVLVGYDRTGYSIFKTLQKLKKDFVVVDFNPDIIRDLIKRNIPCMYGDIGDIEILEKLKLHNIELVISTVPHHQDNLLLIEKVRNESPHAAIFVTSNNANEALELYEAGASYVIIPNYLGGDHLALLLEDITENIDKLLNTKIEHIKDLHIRKRVHKEHHYKK